MFVTMWILVRLLFSNAGLLSIFRLNEHDLSAKRQAIEGDADHTVLLSEAGAYGAPYRLPRLRLDWLSRNV